MLIPLIPKDPDRTDFTCRDGEIDFIIDSNGAVTGLPELSVGDIAAVSLTPVGAASLHTVRIPLLAGEKPKAELLLSGEVSRIDPATAERLTQAIVAKAAETLLDLSVDLRRQGLFILPFRCYTMMTLPDGSLSFPSAQCVALPSAYPPHPEVTAASASDDCLTLTLRFPVRPHRLVVSPPASLPVGCSPRTFISYPLYIPDPKDMRGSIGSVRSAAGGNAVGIRFSFLTVSALKASVAAPEKYYELVGNARTGYRLSSKAAPERDYSCYTSVYGYVPPFARASLLALGEGVDADTDPLDWIADWQTQGEGYLPASLPYVFHNVDPDAPPGSGNVDWPEGIDRETVLEIAGSLGTSRVLLTRPMTLATHEESRRHAEAKAIRTIRVLGLRPEGPALAMLYGSDDCIRWTPLRRFDPRHASHVHAPPRLFWRILVFAPSAHMAVEVTCLSR